MTSTTLTLEEALPGAPFRENHTRIVRADIDDVWPHCLAVTAGEIRTLGPLMSLRSLPSRLTRRSPVSAAPAHTLIDLFTAEGFVLLRSDEKPRDGRASVLIGAAGRFWSPTDSTPVPLGGPEAFGAFATPGYAKTVCRLDAVDLGDGTTRLETETVVAGTDPASTRRFAPYWAIIRLPSGIIRRSWLAAIDRRVRR